MGLDRKLVDAYAERLKIAEENALAAQISTKEFLTPMLADLRNERAKVRLLLEAIQDDIDLLE